MTNRQVGAGLIAFLAIGLTIASGVLHGRIRHAGGLGVDLANEASLLNEIPDSFGSWHRIESNEMNEYTVRLLECNGYHNALYEHREKGWRVFATLLLGPSGPIAVHTPEVCMPAQNYQPTGTRSAIKIKPDGAPVAEVWMNAFQSRDLDNHVALVAYAWTFDGEWEAPDDARWEYAGKPYLYKLQVSSMGAQGSEESQQSAVKDFLKEFTEAVGHTVFPHAR